MTLFFWTQFPSAIPCGVIAGFLALSYWFPKLKTSVLKPTTMLSKISIKILPTYLNSKYCNLCLLCFVSVSIVWKHLRSKYSRWGSKLLWNSRRMREMYHAHLCCLNMLLCLYNDILVVGFNQTEMYRYSKLGKKVGTWKRMCKKASRKSSQKGCVYMYTILNLSTWHILHRA